jgi:hypothetical protein
MTGKEAHMTQLIDQRPGDTGAETDLLTAVQRILAASPEPLTLSKIRVQLPAAHRGITLEALAESLRRQVAANVVIPFPKYRSQQERFWDRPMRIHIAHLLRTALADGPLPWSDLRRRLPAYTLGQAEPLVDAVLQEQVAQGLLYRHPRTSSRGKERFGIEPPNARDYLRDELTALFRRMEPQGFTPAQLRAAALELLHEEEWAAPPGQAPTATPDSSSEPAAPAVAGDPDQP